MSLGSRSENAGVHDDANRETKRPRVEVCARASAADVTAYRTKHEITVMVSSGACLLCIDTISFSLDACITWFIYEERRSPNMPRPLIVFQGENVPAPFMSFEAAGFPSDLLKEVTTVLLYISESYLNVHITMDWCLPFAFFSLSSNLCCKVCGLQPNFIVA